MVWLTDGIFKIIYCMWLWKKILTRNSSSGGNNSILRLKKIQKIQKIFRNILKETHTQIRPKPNLFLIRKVHGNPHPNILHAVISIHPLKWWFTAQSGWVLRTRFAKMKLGSLKWSWTCEVSMRWCWIEYVPLIYYL